MTKTRRTPRLGVGYGMSRISMKSTGRKLLKIDDLSVVGGRVFSFFHFKLKKTNMNFIDGEDPDTLLIMGNCVLHVLRSIRALG